VKDGTNRPRDVDRIGRQRPTAAAEDAGSAGRGVEQERTSISHEQHGDGERRTETGGHPRHLAGDAPLQLRALRDPQVGDQQQRNVDEEAWKHEARHHRQSADGSGEQRTPHASPLGRPFGDAYDQEQHDRRQLDVRSVRRFEIVEIQHRR